MRTFVLIAVFSFFSGSSMAADDLTYETFAEPCRIIDTRLGGGVLISGTPRDFKVAGTQDFLAQGGKDGGCGVPVESKSVLINFVAVNPAGGGNLRGSAYPNQVPATGSFLNYQQLTPILNVANGLPFPICDHSSDPCAFDITVQPNGAGTHLVADVIGYFLADHKHDGADITTGILDESRIDDAIARDSEIVPTVLANDGPGSGLNADLLDGSNSSNFSPFLHTHAGAVYQRTVVVASGGTPTQNGTALLNAMAGITTNSETNMFLLKIEPGLYDLGTSALVMKEWVDVEGSGELATTIRRSAPGSACFNGQGTIYGTNNAELRFLTAENTGGGDCSLALELIGSGMRVSHVTLRATGGSSQNVACYNISGLPILNDVELQGTGGFLIAAGFFNAGGGATLRNVRATGSGAFFSVGVMQGSGSQTTKIEHSVISGELHSVRNDGGSVLVENSQLMGGPVNPMGGTLRCYAVYDENFENAGGLTSCP